VPLRSWRGAVRTARDHHSAKSHWLSKAARCRRMFLFLSSWLLCSVVWGLINLDDFSLIWPLLMRVRVSLVCYCHFGPNLSEKYDVVLFSLEKPQLYYATHLFYSFRNDVDFFFITRI
jgi:hypothetical protein